MKVAGSFITAIIAILVVSATCNADFIPATRLEFDPPQSVSGHNQVDSQQLDSSFILSFSNGSEITSLGALSVEVLHATGEADQLPYDVEVLLSPKHEPGSLQMCLYALLGLGLCKVAPCLNKLSCSAVPEWYHDGGPWQIGHSLAVSPETLNPISVCCFVQPDDTIQLPLANHQYGAMQPLLRKSLFTPCALSSRGPPCMS